MFGGNKRWGGLTALHAQACAYKIVWCVAHAPARVLLKRGGGEAVHHLEYESRARQPAAVGSVTNPALSRGNPIVHGVAHPIRPPLALVLLRRAASTACPTWTATRSLLAPCPWCSTSASRISQRPFSSPLAQRKFAWNARVDRHARGDG